MSYLRNHFRHFVLPGIHALSRANGKTLTAVDIVPRDKQIRPSTKCKFVEAGLLYSLVSSILRKGDPTREIALGLCRQIGRAKDAEFVYAIDTEGRVKSLGEKYDGVEGSDVLHSMLCNSMRRLKRQMRRKGSLLLPGRDVWCWEVMAQKLTVPSTFDARVSRSVAHNESALRTCIDDWKINDWSNVLFFDTGFSGSIPRAIARAEKLDQIDMLLLSSADPSKQIFRTHTGSRAKALAFEYLAKYFVSGTHRDGQPYQELNPLDDFIKAALLTIWLWYHISPTKLPSYRSEIPHPTKAQQEAIKAHYSTTKLNTDFFGTAQFGNPLTVGTDVFTPVLSASDGSTSNFTITSGWATTTTGAWPSAATTLDHLWGAGASGQVILDTQLAPYKSIMGPSKTIFEDFSDQMKKEVDKEIIGKMLAEAGGDASKIPVDKVPPELLYKQTPLIPPGKSFSPAPKKLSFLDPNTFQVADGKTKVSIEAIQDLKSLGIDPAQGLGVHPSAIEALFKDPPTEDGYDLGQYPGPPVIDPHGLKTLAGMKTNEPGLPEVELSIEMDSDPAIAGGHSVAFKKATFTNPDGTKKVYKAPITG